MYILCIIIPISVLVSGIHNWPEEIKNKVYMNIFEYLDQHAYLPVAISTVLFH